MQTEVTLYAEAVAGLLADNTMSKDCLTAISDEASAEIPFGVRVCNGTSELGVKLLNTSAAAMATELRGVTVFGHSFDKPNELGDTGLKPKTAFNILSKGRIYVQVEEAVAIGDDVRVRAVAAGAEVKGAFRATADGTDCVDIAAFARWIRGAEQDGFAVLEIDMTNAALDVADA